MVLRFKINAQTANFGKLSTKSKSRKSGKSSSSSKSKKKTKNKKKRTLKFAYGNLLAGLSKDITSNLKKSTEGKDSSKKRRKKRKKTKKKGSAIDALIANAKKSSKYDPRNLPVSRKEPKKAVSKKDAAIIAVRAKPSKKVINELLLPRKMEKPRKVVHPPKINIPKKPAQKYSEDVLNVSELNVRNGGFNPTDVELNISVLRPEIISVLNFNPIYNGDPRQNRLSLHGKLMEVQHQASYLRRDTLGEFIVNMQNALDDDSMPLFETLRTEYEARLNKLERVINIYDSAIKDMQTLEGYFNIKQIPREQFETTQYLSIKEFFAQRMNFNADQYNEFSNTKIFMQLLADFKAIAESYSINLLNLEDTDRPGDFSPVSVDTTYTINDGFTFNIPSIRSVGSPENATERDFFNSFLNSLPVGPDDRMKILLTILSKEYRVSKAIGNRNNQSILRSKFSADIVGNPFDNIIGIIGNNIFEQPRGQNSIASLAQTPIEDTLELEGVDPQDFFVLPFEEKFVDNDEQDRTFVPGTAYFVDTIFNLKAASNPNSRGIRAGAGARRNLRILGGNETFNIQPVKKYVDQVDRKIGDATSLINDLFELNKDTDLNPDKIYRHILESFRTSTDGLVTKDNVNKDQSIITGLFKLANTDNELKNLLFQFLLLMGLQTNQDNNKQSVWTEVATEFRDITNFSAVEIPRPRPRAIRSRANRSPEEEFDTDLLQGPQTVLPFIKQVAVDIETRARQLIVIKQFSSPVERRPISRLRARRSRRRSDDLRRVILSSLPIGASNTGQRLAEVINSQLSSAEDGSISKVLEDVATQNIGENSSNLCKEFVDLSVRFTKAAATEGKRNYLVEDGTGRTRYNFLSTSTQMLIIFEMLSSFTEKYACVNYKQSKDDIAVDIDFRKQKLIQTTIDEILGEDAPFLRRFKDAMGRTKSKTKKEQAQTGALKRADVPAKKEALGALKAESKQSPSTPRAIATRASGASVASFAFRYGSILRNFGKNYKLPAYAIVPKLNFQAAFGRALAKASTANKVVENNFVMRDALQDLRIQEAPASAPDFKLKEDIVNILNKVRDEDVILANIVHILNVISYRLNQAEQFVNTTYTHQKLDSLKRTVPGQTLDLNLIRNPTHLRTSAYFLDVYKERLANELNEQNPILLENRDGEQSNLIISDITRKEVKESIYSYFAQNEFSSENLADIRIKIMSVGIPAGFTQRLVDRIDVNSIDKDSFIRKQSDVITVNVYKRNTLLNDIVFKPQRFIFDMSMFQTSAGIAAAQPQVGQRFGTILNRIETYDYEGILNKEKYTTGRYRNQAKLIQRDAKYDFLTSEEKTDLVENHAVSFLLEKYIDMLTGMKINESTFSLNKVPSQVNTIFEDLVKEYFINILEEDVPANSTLEEMLQNETVTQDTKDIIKMILDGNGIFDPSKAENDILRPKLFDRVLHLPVNIDSFEVDVEATEETESGKRALKQAAVENQLVTRGEQTFLKDRQSTDIIFEDYFITVENRV